jgi:maltose O-acetyltransferase
MIVLPNPRFNPVQETIIEREERAEPSALQKLVAGQPFIETDVELAMLRQHARKLAREYNQTPEHEHMVRTHILASIFGSLGENPEIESPLYVEYGRHVYAGHRLTVGPNCAFYDVGRIMMGDDVRLDAGVQLYAVARPSKPDLRSRGYAQAAPITIEDHVWIGGQAVVNPGVTIGAGTTIAPGSIVMEDIPAGVYAAGNPCKVVL